MSQSQETQLFHKNVGEIMKNKNMERVQNIEANVLSKNEVATRLFTLEDM